MIIRKIEIEDSEKYLKLKYMLDTEAEFLLIQEGERKETVKEVSEYISKIRNSENKEIFIADVDGEIAGYLSIIGGDYKRNKHSGYIVIAILEKYTGMGIGKGLFEKMEEWAEKVKLHRLELGVIDKNTRAKKLYLKKGFEIEGVKKDMYLIDGEYSDEIMMSKIL